MRIYFAGVLRPVMDNETGLLDQWKSSVPWLSLRARKALAYSHCKTLNDIGIYGLRNFKSLAKVGPKVYKELCWLYEHGGEEPPSWEIKRYYRMSHPETLICQQCKKEFQRRKGSRVKSKPPKVGVFCNQQCYAEWKKINFKGENGPNFKPKSSARWSGQWERNRTAALERDGNKCIRCSSTKKIEVHHKIPWAEGQEDPHRLDNLETLCGRCHRLDHVTEERVQQLKEGNLKSWEGTERRLSTSIRTKKLWKEDEEFRTKVVEGSKRTRDAKRDIQR